MIRRLTNGRANDHGERAALLLPRPRASERLAHIRTVLREVCQELDVPWPELRTVGDVLRQDAEKWKGGAE